MTEVHANPLSLESVVSAAIDQSGLDDFGDPSFIEPLSRWLAAADREGHLTAAGVMGVQASAVRLLVNRLRMEADIKTHPEILDQPLAPPIVVVGLARSGTTKLQRVLSCDPGSQKLSYWRLINPAPFPGAADCEPDSRIAFAVAQAQKLAELYPEVWAHHSNDGTEADEEGFLMSMTFEALGTALQPRVPSFMDWWLERPRQGPYVYLRRCLQYLQWQDDGGPGRPWVMKTPAHLGNIDLLFGIFPGATVVHCHRHPAISLLSNLRLAEAGRAILSEYFDRREVAEMLLSHSAGEMARNLAQRDQLVAGKDIVDVPYTDIVNDSVGVVREIYRMRGATLSSEAEAAMKDWDEAHPPHAGGGVRRSLEDYGINEVRVEDAFEPYIKRFLE